LRSTYHVLNIASAQFSVEKQIEDSQSIFVCETFEVDRQLPHKNPRLLGYRVLTFCEKTNVENFT
ncbi:MAG: hypothetical protein WBW03_00810, partial [Silvibacterium sp.]